MNLWARLHTSPQLAAAEHVLQSQQSALARMFQNCQMMSSGLSSMGQLCAIMCLGNRCPDSVKGTHELLQGQKKLLQMKEGFVRSRMTAEVQLQSV